MCNTVKARWLIKGAHLCLMWLQIQKMVISGGSYRPDTLKPTEVVSLLIDDDEMEKKCGCCLPYDVCISAWTWVCACWFEQKVLQACLPYTFCIVNYRIYLYYYVCMS